MNHRRMHGQRGPFEPYTLNNNVPPGDAPMRDAPSIGARYAMRALLGRGGSAMVYLALDCETQQFVAVKVLHQELTASVSNTRFLQEVAIGQTLHHPHILPIIESGTVEQRTYYTMPYIEGRSLRDRLQHQRQLPIDDVLTIAEQAASALDYAHSRWVIHRDIKPANMLLGPSGVLVADFGIARAIAVASGESLTDTGVAVGTPEYMSPEQAGGEKHIDGRTDVYGLACVVYEMLAGEPPFTGPTVQAIVARHFNEPPRSIRVVRPTLSVSFERALERGLAKVPADRFATAGEFVAALRRHEDVADASESRGADWSRPDGAHLTRGSRVGSVSGTANTSRARGLLTGPRVVIGGGAVIVAALWGVLRTTNSTFPFGPTRPSSAMATDSSTIAVVVDDVRDSLATQAAAAVRRHLTTWRDLTVIDESRDAASRKAALKSGHIVHVRGARSGDSLDIELSMDNGGGGKSTAHARVSGVADMMSERLLASLADSVLFGSDASAARAERSKGTNSVFARRAYLRGIVAMNAGNFARADSQLSMATSADPDFPQALLWLTQVRVWSRLRGAPWEQFLPQATRGEAQRHSLSETDSVRLAAYNALADTRYDDACAQLRRVTALESNDFASWYALGDCLRRDDVVVPDKLSPSGWRFRASAEESVRAFERAFKLKAAIAGALGARSFVALQRIFATSGARTRDGMSAGPAPIQFSAYPTWDDSLAYVPSRSDTTLRFVRPLAIAEAVQHQRKRLLDVTSFWRNSVPSAAEPLEAVALAMDLTGMASARDSLHRAREMLTVGNAKLRIAASEVLLRIKFSLPDDIPAIRAASLLADSLLRTHPPASGDEPRLLGSLAALLGHATLAAAYATAGGGGEVAPSLSESGPALLAYASLGGPADSVKVFERRARNGISALPASERPAATAQWIWRSASLAFPDVKMAALDSADSKGAPVLSTTVPAAAGDTARVRAAIAVLRNVRVPMPKADVMFDALFPETASLAHVGDAAGAISWIDDSLNSLRFSSSTDLGQIPRAGALVRAMALRAELAEKVGDHASARKWAAALQVLWAAPDAFLAPTVVRMKQLAK